LGKQIAVSDTFLVRPGIAGFSYWQLSDDSDDGPGTYADERKQLHAIGPEINLFWLPHLLQLNLRALWEFEGENSQEGSQVVVTLTKSW